MLTADRDARLNLSIVAGGQKQPWQRSAENRSRRASFASVTQIGVGLNEMEFDREDELLPSPARGHGNRNAMLTQLITIDTITRFIE